MTAAKPEQAANDREALIERGWAALPANYRIPEVAPTLAEARAYCRKLAETHYENFHVVIRDVWRFEQEDTLIFRIELVNPSENTIYYKPQDLAVRLEDRIYTQSLADASGIMPPKSTTPAFFAITGNGQGGGGNLAPDNKWNVLVVRANAATSDFK